ncbi:MAG: hypothetical protein Q9M43_03455 [Sulfurimonas sp.]|nr:hypothetical protein [Sulfurimonas sp.]
MKNLFKRDIQKVLIPFIKPFRVSVNIKKKIIIVEGGMDILEAS